MMALNIIVKPLTVSGTAEGGGVEPQWLKPLTDLAGRVQYPLATPSKHVLHSTI